MNREKTVSLHSRYNPQAEAERYVNKLSLSEKTRYYILIEPGLGYIVEPLKKKAPEAKIISLHVEKPANYQSSAEAAALSDYSDGISIWYPETGITLLKFLEEKIPESEALKIQILEWRPALAVYGKAYLTLVEEAAYFIKCSCANVRTVAAFGARWFRNFFKNLDFLKEALYPTQGFPLSLPLLVTGAGPGLEGVIPKIKEEHCKRRIFILAASSSLMALEAQGIIPDMVISTDGSLWARFHLYGLFRGRNGKVCLAASLTATLPSQCGSLPVLVISDGSLWQKLVLEGLKIPFVALPQRGTVTATALDLAFSLTGQKLFISGMDLVNQDIRSHARPYSFDRFVFESSGRMNPQYSQTYKRSSLLKTGGSYGVYASWFEKQLPLYPRHLYPIGNNNPVFGPPETGNFEGLLIPEQAKGNNVNTKAGDEKLPENFKTVKLNFNGRPSEKAFHILERALNDPAYKTELGQELSSQLLPNQKTATPGDLIETIRSRLGFVPGRKNG